MAKATRDRLLLASIIGVALTIQSAGILRPYTGHYASYQATVMASMARNFLRFDFANLFLPQTDIIMVGERSLHLNQYPFPSLVAALAMKLMGGSLEFWGRFQAIVFNLISGLLVFKLAGRYFGDRRVAWASLVLYFFAPFTLIYGQAFLSESFSLALLLAALWFLDRSFVLSALIMSLAVAGRIHFITLMPVFWFVLWRSNGRWVRLAVFTAVSLALPALWYAHTYYVGLTAPNVHTSIFFQVTARAIEPASLLLSPDYYRKILDDWSSTVFTPIGFTFLFLALLAIHTKEKGLRVGYLGFFSACSVIFLVPEKVMKHDFYFYGAFPFAVWLAAFVLSRALAAWPWIRSVPKYTLLAGGYLVLSARYFAHPIYDPKGIGDLMTMRREVAEHSQRDERFIVFGDDPGSPLYYIDRPSWTLQPSLIGKGLPPYLRNQKYKNSASMDIEETEKAMQNAVDWVRYLKKQGAQYLIAPDPGELERQPGLLTYLEREAVRLTHPKRSFYLFRLS